MSYSLNPGNDTTVSWSQVYWDTTGASTPPFNSVRTGSVRRSWDHRHDLGVGGTTYTVTVTRCPIDRPLDERREALRDSSTDDGCGRPISPIRIELAARRRAEP